MWLGWWAESSAFGVVTKVSSPGLTLASEGVPASVHVACDGDAGAGTDAISSAVDILAWLPLLLPFGWCGRGHLGAVGRRRKIV